MNKFKKPKIIIFFTILFIWLLLKNISYIINYKTSLDYNLWFNIGYPSLFFIFISIEIVLTILIIYFLIKPKYIGFKIIIGSFILAILEQIILLFVIKDISLISRLYIEGKKAKGLPLTESRIELLSSPYSTHFMIGSSILLILIFMYLIYRNKDYFEKK